MLGSLDLTMDDNKENQTPDGGQGELDWAQQYTLDQEREEQELQQALAQSLQEHVCLFNLLTRHSVWLLLLVVLIQILSKN